jgi:hypothetical protein
VLILGLGGMKKFLSLAFVSCTLLGCSSMSSTYSSVSSSASSTFNSVFSDGTVDMTFNCNPPGATIIEQGGNKLGTCPVTVQYHPNSDQQKEGKFYTKKITAVWADGSAVSVPSLTVDIPANHKAQYTFMNTGDKQQLVWNGPDNYGALPSAPPQPLYDSGTNSGLAPVSHQTIIGDGGDYRISAPVTEPSMSAGAGNSGGHQDRDFFDGFNRKVTCEINNQIDSEGSGCSPNDGIKEFQ